MCGRLAQAQSREEYLAHLVEAAERDIAWDSAPIGRYNVAPGTKVLLLKIFPTLPLMQAISLK